MTGVDPAMLAICQVVDYDDQLTCPARESGGWGCEVVGPHVQHRIGDHTIRHVLAGNGYACAAVDPPTPNGSTHP